MAQGVWRDVLGREGRADLSGGGHVFVEQVGDGVAAEASTGSVGEQRIGLRGVPFGGPAVEQPGGGPGQRGAALFAAFAGLCRSVGNAESWPALTALLVLCLLCVF
jgi:hypothetical protein